MSRFKSIIGYFVDFIALTFVLSFIYSLNIERVRLPESETKFDNFVFEIAFWILGAWMLGVTFLGIGKMINHFFSKILLTKN